MSLRVSAEWQSRNVLLVALSPAAHASSSCTAATLKGNYAIQSLGQVSGGAVGTLFLIANDGNGNLTGSGTESLGGTIYTGVTLTGTYSVTSTCWFTATSTDSLGNTLSIEGTAFQNGAELIGLSTSAGTLLQVTAYRLAKSTCTLAGGAGTHMNQYQAALSPYGAGIVTQEATFGKTGSGSGSYVANFDGNSSNGTFTGTESINADCTYTATVTFSNGNVSHTFGIGGIKQNDVVSVSIGTDSGWVIVGTHYNSK
jgi:hypothetical protein